MATTFVAPFRVVTAAPASALDRVGLERSQRRVIIAFVLLAFVPLPSNSAIVVWTLLTGYAIVSAVGRSAGRTRFLVSLTVMGALVLSIAVIRGLLLGIATQGMTQDAMDALRYAPAVAIAAALVRGGRGVDLTPTLAVVCIVDAAISIGEFFVPAPFKLIYMAHGTEHHWESALREAARTAGLYGSPGEHGSALALFGMIVLFRLVRQPRPLYMVGAVAAIVSVLMSQSQTSFVSFALGASMIAAWSVAHLRRTSTVRAVRWLVVFTAVLGPMLVAFVIQRLRYLTFLFKVGSSRSSYQLREDLWSSIWERWDDSAASVLLGGGRTWLGEDLTRVVDSDLRFVLFVYGVVGWTILVVAYMVWVRVSRVFRPEAVIAAVMALVSSWASSFIADARMVAVVVVVLVFTPPDTTRPARSPRSAESTRGVAPAAAH